MLYSGTGLMHSLKYAKFLLANAMFVAVLAQVLLMMALRKQGPSSTISAGIAGRFA